VLSLGTLVGRSCHAPDSRMFSFTKFRVDEIFFFSFLIEGKRRTIIFLDYKKHDKTGTSIKQVLGEQVAPQRSQSYFWPVAAHRYHNQYCKFNNYISLNRVN
jgi:hypothetical protein